MRDVRSRSLRRNLLLHAPYLLLLAGLVASSGGCGGDEGAGNARRPPSSPAVNSVERERARPPENQPAPDAGALAPQTPEPDVSLSANGVGDPAVFRGWPLILEAGLLHPGAFQPDADQNPMLLAAESGPWTNALEIVITDEDGQRHAWPFQLTETPVEETFRLDARTPAVLVWWLPPEQSARISPGSYELLTVLNTWDSGAENGWQGTVRSMPILVHISDEPPALDAEQVSEKHQLFAAYYFVRGDGEQAVQQIDELLNQQPRNTAAWELKGDLLAKNDKVEEALAAYGAAIDAFLKQYGTKVEPPAELLIKQNALLNDLFEHPPAPEAAAQDTNGGC